VKKREDEAGDLKAALELFAAKAFMHDNESHFQKARIAEGRCQLFERKRIWRCISSRKLSGVMEWRANRRLKNADIGKNFPRDSGICWSGGALRGVY